jgi:hypothetical protein
MHSFDRAQTCPLCRAGAMAAALENLAGITLGAAPRGLDSVPLLYGVEMCSFLISPSHNWSDSFRIQSMSVKAPRRAARGSETH